MSKNNSLDGLALDDSRCVSALFVSAKSLSSENAAIQTTSVTWVSTASGRNLLPCVSTQTHAVREVKNTTFQNNLISHLVSRMLYELEQPQDAFVGFKTLQALGHQDVSYKYTLTNRRIDIGPLQCVGVSWNATGAMLSAVFGRPDLCGWCDDSGILCCWSLFREDFSPNNPAYSVEHTSCFTAIACHPSQPSLIAAGSFNGEILVYDFASTNDFLKACSDIDEYFHREPISALHWTRNVSVSATSMDAYHLVSLSGEGKVLWWSVKTIEHASAETSGRLPFPVRGMTIPLYDPEMKAIGPAIGGTAMALDLSGILIGSEGGLVLRCFPPTKTIKQHKTAMGDSILRWEKAAADIVDYLPSHVQIKLCKHVERWVNGARGQVVTAHDIFTSKPKVQHIFPSPAGTVTVFEAHVLPSVPGS